MIYIKPMRERTTASNLIRSHGLFGVAVAMAAAALGASPQMSQQAIVVTSEVSCPECRIDLTHVVTLGGAEIGAGLLCPDARLARDSRGRYYAVRSCDRSEVLVFDAQGRFLQNIGRQGQGPGEFVRTENVWIGEGDTVHVVEQNGRLSVFSASYELVHSVYVPGSVPREMLFMNGSWIVAERINSPERIGLPIHVLNNAAEVERSFGADDRLFRFDRLHSVFRSLASSASDRIWAAHFQRYEVELYTLGGDLLKHLIRRAEWFEPWQVYDPPLPCLWDIRTDDRANLWVLVAVRDRDYRGLSLHEKLERREGNPDFHPPLFPEERHVYWDTVIEAIDPDSGRLIQTYRSDFLFMRWLDDLVYTPRDTPDGDTYFDVWQVHLKRTPNERSNAS